VIGRRRHGRTRRWARLRSDGGFGLVELLVAMTVLSVGILTLVAGFSSGYTALDRADRVGTASVLADMRMEAFRARTYSAIPVGTSTLTYSKTSSPPSPDGRDYTVTAIVTLQNAGTAAETELATVTVRDSSGRVWTTQQSTFDQYTGA
jgi:prepilin-type N-terminal cleavage/methylation domain-containing protein